MRLGVIAEGKADIAVIKAILKVFILVVRDRAMREELQHLPWME